MNNETKIEFYLLQLDRELSGLTVSQRAEIVTEIKSHIRDVMEKNPSHPVDQILQDLGTARQVADRYLAAKGVARAASGSRGKRVFKWLAIGTVAFFAVIFLGGMALVWYFSPLIKVDEARGRVELFGGLIDVNEELGKVRVGSLAMDELEKELDVGGEQDITAKSVKLLKIPFNTAKLVIEPALDGKLKWQCKAPSSQGPKVDVSAGVVTLNLDVLNLAKCQILLPPGLATEVRGVNGHMDVDSPRADMTIHIANGKVNIHPDPRQEYDFDVKVVNGLQDVFPRSRDQKAVRVKVDVVNGLVRKQ